MHKRIAVVVLAAVLLTAAACGVPSGGKPILVGHAPPLGPVGAAGIAPTAQTSFTNPADFVESGYLGALAGQTSLVAQDSVRNQFVVPKKKVSIKAGDSSPVGQVTVVRVLPGTAQHAIDATGDEYTVTVNVQVIGVFDPSTGALAPALASPKPKKLDFTVTTDGPLKLTRLPGGFYMSEDAFRAQYIPQTIYFWDGNGGLIPDQRYVPRWWKIPLAATAIVNWLLGVPNPPTWFGTASEVQGKVTNGAILNVGSNYVTLDNKSEFVVNLNQTSMTPTQQAQFVAEVRWSLLQLPTFGIAPSNTSLPVVKLLISNQVVQPAADPNAYEVNAAANREQSNVHPPAVGHLQPDSPQPVGSQAFAYAIENGRVTALGYGAGGGVSAFNTDNPAPTDPTRTLADSKNTDVVMAALGTIDGVSSAALVRSVSGRQELWISRAKSGRAKYVKAMTATTFLRPQWLPDGDLAVVADQKFYVIRNGTNEPLPLAVLGPGAISAYSVGPDGHRVAFVSGGAVWIAILSGKQPDLSPARPINLAPELTHVTTVAWSTVDHLVVGGSAGGKSRVLETSSDGVYYQMPPDLNKTGFYFDTTITQIESYPISPLDANGSSAVLVATSPKGILGGRANPVPVNPSLKVTPTNPFFADPG